MSSVLNQIYATSLPLIYSKQEHKIKMALNMAVKVICELRAPRWLEKGTVGQATLCQEGETFVDFPCYKIYRA